MDGAQVAIVVLSSTAGTARYAMEKMRGKGIRAGLIKPRVFRPFPAQELVDALQNVHAVAVMDRSVSPGSMSCGGPLWLELLAAAQLYQLNVPIVDYVSGLGGREIKPGHIEGIYGDLVQIAETGEIARGVVFLDVRGEEHQSAAPHNGRHGEVINSITREK